MAHFNNFGCYLIEVNLDDQSLFRLVLELGSGISTSLGLLVTFRQHELHSQMHFLLRKPLVWLACVFLLLRRVLFVSK